MATARPRLILWVPKESSTYELDAIWNPLKDTLYMDYDMERRVTTEKKAAVQLVDRSGRARSMRGKITTKSIIEFVADKKTKRSSNGDGEKPKFIFFSMEGCSYCVAFGPMWEELKKQDLGVTYVEYKYPKSTKHEEYGVSMFPTLIYDDGKSRHKFEKERSIANIKKFIRSKRA